MTELQYAALYVAGGWFFLWFAIKSFKITYIETRHYSAVEWITGTMAILIWPMMVASILLILLVGLVVHWIPEWIVKMAAYFEKLGN